MSSPIIRVEKVAKRYLIGAQRSKDDGMRHVLEDALRAPWDWLSGRRRPAQPSEDEFWALRDVSFEVNRGDVVGVIGRNGAGKSTLLKVLSRITEPSRGRITLGGRVASLLEVGTGFHPELTGRENIFLNGAILGMTRAEIRSKFDEIVEFAEVSRFLDTPVKRYSSGMYVRLAFAVAAHLEPEILIVDEVLAVGDATFQKKCLAKMQDVSSGGRTVLFVSHNMTAVSALCNKAVLLEAGRASGCVPVQEAIGSYLREVNAQVCSRWRGPLENARVAIRSAEVESPSASGWTSEQPIRVTLDFELKTAVHGLIAAWELRNASDHLLAYSAWDDRLAPPTVTTPVGRYRHTMVIPPHTLAEGDYSLSLDLGIHNQERLVPDRSVTLRFRVDNVEGLGRRHPSHWHQIFRPDWIWTSHHQPGSKAPARPEPALAGGHAG